MDKFADIKSLIELSEEEIKGLLQRLKEEGRAGEDKHGNPYVRAEFTGLQVESVEFDSRKEFEDLCAEVGVKAEEGGEDRVKRFRGSDETVDRHGDIIRVAGWDLVNYKKNPVFLWGHEYGNPPIGKSLKTSKITNGDDKLLEFMILFAGEDVYQWADTIFRLYDSGFLKASSVGFYPKKVTRIEDDEERSKLGLGRHGLIYEKQELLELSGVSIPANPNALTDSLKDAFKEGTLDEAYVKSLAGNTAVPITYRKGLVESFREFDAERGKSIIVTEDIQTESEEKQIQDNADWTEIRYVVRDEKKFKKGSLKRLTKKKDKPKIFSIVGKLENEDKASLQSLRFPKKDGWEKKNVAAWVKENKDDIKDFEELIDKMPDIIESFMVEESVFEAIEKAGAVLNKKNKELLKSAAGNVRQVLANAGAEDDGGKSLVDVLEKFAQGALQAIEDHFKDIEGKLLDHVKTVLYSEEIKQFLKERSGPTGDKPKEGDLYSNLIESAEETKKAFNKE